MYKFDFETYKNYFLLFRVKQYIKNLLIFVPVIFALKANNIYLLYKCFFLFISFSLIASTIYIFNDICDIKKDSLHKEKKNRPIASGKIPIKTTLYYIPVFLIVGFILAFIVSFYAAILIFIYFLLNIAYSLRFKHYALVDISIISIGFLIRLFVGGISTNTHITEWLVIITLALSLFISLAKRRDDVIKFNSSGFECRSVVKSYNLEFINCAMSFMASITVLCYIMYTINVDTINKFNSKYIYLTSIFVILGFLRYFQITFVQQKSGNPVNLLYRDKPLLMICSLWFIVFISLIYFSSF